MEMPLNVKTTGGKFCGPASPKGLKVALDFHALQNSLRTCAGPSCHPRGKVVEVVYKIGHEINKLKGL